MPLGESRFDVAIRVHEAFGTFHRDAERNGVRNIIIICHGVTLRAFVMMWRQGVDCIGIRPRRPRVLLGCADR